MATLIHLCRKDFASARFYLLGSWLMFLGSALAPIWISERERHSAGMYLSYVSGVVPLLVLLLALNIQRGDAFIGSSSFIGTRPVTRTMLWFSKLVSITAFVLFPCLLAHFIADLLLRVNPGPADWAMWWIERTLGIGMLAAIACVVGTHTRNLIYPAGLTIALMIGFLALNASLGHKSFVFRQLAEVQHHEDSRRLVALTLMLLAGPLLAWCWIVGRRVWLSAAAIVGTMAAIALISTHWNLNFVDWLARDESQHPQSAKNLRVSWSGKPLVSRGWQEGGAFTFVRHNARVDGLPAGWFAYPAAVRSFARFRDGHSVSSECTNSATYGEFLRTMLPSLGIGNGAGMQAHEFYQTTWFEGETWRLREFKDPCFSVTGESWVELYSPSVLAVLPVESGAAASQGRLRFQIEKVTATRDEIWLKLAVNRLDLRLRGDQVHLRHGIALQLMDPKTGKHSDISTGRILGDGPRLTGLSHHFQFQGGDPNEVSSDAREFLKGAKLYLIGARYGGTARVAFEIPEIRLEEPR